MAKTVGIVGYDGSVHCMDHASTIGSYESEILSTDPARECWCGKRLGGRKKPSPSIVSQYRKMNDGAKGRRESAGSFVPRASSRSYATRREL